MQLPWFRLRLERRTLQVARRLDDQGIIADLRAQLARLPQDNINIQPHLDELRRLQQTWPQPGQASDHHLSQTIAPLMRFDWTEALVEIQFRVLCERLTCAWLSVRDDEVARLAERARETVGNLADTVREVAAVAEQRAWVRSPGFWAHLDLERLQTLQDTFAPLMRFRQSQRPEIIELDLPDQISTRRWIIYGPAGEGAFADGYRERVEADIRRLAESQPALIKLKRGDAPDGDDLATLTRALNQSDLFVTEEVLRELYEQPAANLTDFMRHILELRHLPSWEERIRAAFEQFIQDHGDLSASQINFLRAIRAAVLQHARLTRDQLDRSPLARVGRVETLFKPAQINEILDFANRLVDAA
ncbi:type I restriction-modification enzyme R subunit C-terminal domain-containing protein [uncultured Thiodictyon sp.]|jgi:type I restriction enzyme R subunit|uniref:type I restriction-modification enzyme R subunit C-terminal domain-containing protein n=1 Tax=uncultured Thiodictyon sp. TaxID=1846217 RepID=UPI0025E8D995|nr:type I restriction-modification enzyme R subunit C-terminal domain-containing protein [uncultured Thiodictyon sp.]